MFHAYKDASRPLFITSDSFFCAYAAVLERVVHQLLYLQQDEQRQFFVKLAAGASLPETRAFFVLCLMTQDVDVESFAGPREVDIAKDCFSRIDVPSGWVKLSRIGARLDAGRFCGSRGTGLESGLAILEAVVFEGPGGAAIVGDIIDQVRDDAQLKHACDLIRRTRILFGGNGVGIGVTALDVSPEQVGDAVIEADLLSHPNGIFAMRLFRPLISPDHLALHQALSFIGIRGGEHLPPTAMWLIAGGPFGTVHGRHHLTAWPPGLGALMNADSGDGLVADSVRALRYLGGEVPGGASPVFHGEAWQKKQIAAQMGCWARLRCAVGAVMPAIGGALHTTSADYAGAVEPSPEFFSDMERLLRRYSDEVRDILWSALGAAERSMAAERMRSCERDGWPASLYQARIIIRMILREQGIASSGERSLWFEKLPERLMQNGLSLGEIDAVLAFVLSGAPASHDLARMADMAYRLASMADRCAVGLPPLEQDAPFVRRYGDALASLLAGGVPRGTVGGGMDRLVAIWKQSFPEQCDRILYVGNGPARTIRIPLEVEGKLVDHFGAVCDYRELVSERILGAEAVATQEGAEVPPALRGLVR